MLTKPETLAVIPERLLWREAPPHFDERESFGLLTLRVVSAEHEAILTTQKISRAGIRQIWDEFLTEAERDALAPHRRPDARLEDLLPPEITLSPRQPVAIDLDPARPVAGLLRPLAPSDPQPTAQAMAGHQAATANTADRFSETIWGQPLRLTWPLRDRRNGKNPELDILDFDSGARRRIAIQPTEVERLINTHLDQSTQARLGIERGEIFKTERDLPPVLDLRDLPPVEATHIKLAASRPALSVVKSLPVDDTPTNKDWLSYMRGREAHRQQRNDPTP